MESVSWATVVVEALTALIFFGLGELNARRRERARERKEQERSNKLNRFTWEDLIDGADKVGEHVFSRFKADVVISFAGQGAIFANLVIARFMDHKAARDVQLFIGKFIEKGTQLEPHVSNEFDRVTGERFDILLPKALRLGEKSWKIAVLDETVTTGFSMRAVRHHLTDLGYGQVFTASFVCCDAAKTIDSHPVDYSAVQSVDNKFRLPWGKSPL